MKAKILWLAVGLFLSAAAVQAQQETNRFHGGSYDGWDQNAMTNALSLAGAEVRWHGGAYDGWDQNAMTNALSLAGAEVRWHGGAYDGWDQNAMTNALSLAGPEVVRFHGGAYDGWDQNAMTSALSLAGPEVRWHGGAYDGWDRNAMTNGLPVAPAVRLAFTTQPGGGVSNGVWAVPPVVTVQDANSNTVPTDTSTVTLSIGTNAGPGGVLSGTLSQVAVAGVADFTTNALRIDKVGAGYTLVASNGALTSATSGVFNITATIGPPAKLAFTTQPGGGTNHVAWGTQPAVTVQDASGNTVTGSAQTVTLAILNNPAGGVLSGTTNVPVDLNTGIAIFSGLSIDKVGAGYTLVATNSGLTSATSGVFNITLGAAAMLAFTTQPGGGFSDVPWAVQPAVTVQDAYGNTVTTDVSTVTLAIGTNAGPGGVLSGILTKAAVAGVANFSANALRINQPGNGYTLVATDGALASATSSVFNITVDPMAVRWHGGAYDGWDRNSLSNVMPLASAAKLAFTAQPGGGISNAVWAVPPVVTVRDAYGYTVVTDTSTVTLAIGTNAGPGGVLSGTVSQVAVAGVADFSTNALSIDKVGTGYTLVASDGALTSATSGVFNINATIGPPAKLAFTTQPGGGTNHVAWGTQPAVTLQDASGYTVTGTAQTVTLAILSNPGGGVLSGTTNVTVDVNTGIAIFTNLSIDKVGAGYTLTATGGTLTSATSSVFNITLGAAAMLAFTTQPGGGFSDVPWAVQPAVTVQDAYGNTVTTDVSTVALAIGTNAGPAGVLSGTLTKAAVAGVANFSANALRINQPGIGYTLVATDGALASATSGVFNITVDPTAIRWHGGAYDGWDRNSAAVYAPLSLANGTLFMFQ